MLRYFAAGFSASRLARVLALTCALLISLAPAAAVAAPGSHPLGTPPVEGRSSSQTHTLSSASTPELAVYGVWAAVSIGSTAIAWITLSWMVQAWRTPATLRRTRFAGDAEPAEHSFSLLVPARHEEQVLGTTLDTLARLDHPDFEIIAIIGHDDDATRAVAEAAAARNHNVRVVIDRSWPKSKPKGLNTALPACRGDIVGVFDAEDEVHPGLLRRVDRLFQTSGAHVVQGGVQLMNYRSSWYSLRNVLEYFFWFSSRLHFHARQRFIPLGGNTVFVRADVLRAVGGWDPECLAEDCELGVRLSVLGAKTEVAYESELVTREETPHSIPELVKQRTRWSQGFLQVLRAGHWRKLPRRQRLLGAYTLATPFLQAFSGLLIPLAFATAFLLKAPVPVVLITFMPLAPMLIILAVEIAALGHFCKSYGQRARAYDYLRLVLGFFPYQLLLSYAAVRAAARELLGVRNWEKTAHVGAHLEARQATPDSAAST